MYNARISGVEDSKIRLTWLQKSSSQRLVRIIMHDTLTLKARAKKLGQSDMIHARGSSWPFVKSSVVLTVIPRFRRRARDVY